MFKTFFLREVSHGLKRPMVYIFFFIIGLMVYGAVVSDNVTIGGSIGNVYKNAPHVITTFVSVLSIFGLLMAAAYFNNAALREFKYNFNEILFTTPLSRAGFFFGRFFGALFLATIPLMGVYAGVLIGTGVGLGMEYIDADRIGPFYLETFVNNYFLFILPNMFVAGTLIFALAMRFRNTTISFLGALLLIIAYIITGQLMSEIDNETMAALCDTFGIRAYSVDTRYFTPEEKNTISPGFSGLLILNRLIWMGFGLVILAISYFTFSFKERNKKVRKKKEDTTTRPKGIPVQLPRIEGQFGSGIKWAHFRSFLAIDARSILKSRVFAILFLFTAILQFSSLAGGFEYFGLHAYPVTYKIVDTISNYNAIFAFIIMIFFSGELIWKERDHHISEVLDATPHISLPSLMAKAIAVTASVVILHFSSIFFGIIYQLLNGYTNLEMGIYLEDFWRNWLPTYLIWSGMFIFLQVLINHKYLGYFLSVLMLFLLDLIYSMLDISSRMLNYGSIPALRYSDMNAFGPNILGANWFSAYWLLMASLLLLVSGLFLVRGQLFGWRHRWRLAKINLNRKYLVYLCIPLVAFTAVGANVYYNTKVLHTYMTSDEREEHKANYEKKYKKYEGIALPKIQAVTYHIDIFPEERNLHVRAEMRMKNESDTPIDSIHFSINEDWETHIQIPGGRLAVDDQEYDYQIYALEEPLLPGGEFDMVIETKYITRGFRNGYASNQVVRNGTFVNNHGILPTLGYASSYEISDKNDRKKYDLPTKDRMPELEDPCGKACMKNYLSGGLSDWVMVETYISTSSDQVAVAPGSLLREWEENGRKHYHYKVDHPSANFYSFISARYQVRREKWKDVDVEIYYDAKHEVNIDKMVDAVVNSLEYYTTHFGPYYHKQARIIEFPRYSSFAQAFPGTMPYSEGLGFIVNLEDEEKNNVIDAIVAHEMGHQWWAHQEISAEMQGATMLTESFSEYSALMVMKDKVKDDMRMKDFLKYDFNRYLRGRSSEEDIELPLYKVENQGHIHYGKGSLIMYALQDYIGADSVNSALRSFLEEYRYAAPPYPTSLDFLRHLKPRMPDSLHYLITDWFKEITLYDNRVQSATYQILDDGQYEVTMEIESYKMKADTLGRETKVPVGDWIDIGVYADKDEKELLYSDRKYFDDEQLSFTVLVDTVPAKVAVDPKRILIERIYKDNTKVVEDAGE